MKSTDQIKDIIRSFHVLSLKGFLTDNQKESIRNKINRFIDDEGYIINCKEFCEYDLIPKEEGYNNEQRP